ncbi:L-fuculose-phosphate aldolase [Pleurostoma richardsiae]|uniref:L-fuculose-phosphate aldolase n=1 Tax=Pleurostoma richardsiae TaxID=41990 RepID=A0AA38VFA0_9PEZI|nr:L-fuculose-phosphate aldolase [Pleurostoma richardsiae]
MATMTETAVVKGELKVESPKKPAGYDPDDPTTNLNVMPTFADKFEERQWAKQQMVAIFRVFAKHGYADGFNGHISLRDPVESLTFWINPYAKHFSRICVSDLIRVDHDGKYVEGPKGKINAAGFIIHSNIHKARPDINVICHAHSPYGRAWSAFGRPIEMLAQDCCYFYNDLSVYGGFGGVVLASAEGLELARQLGPKNKNLILQNHGLISCGSNPAEAAAYFMILERACQTQILAESAAANGIEKRLVGDEEAAYTKSWLGTTEVMYMWFQPEYEAVLYETKGEFLN